MSPASLQIVAVGNVSLNGRYHRLLAARGPEYPFQKIAPAWRDAALRTANLESAITDRPRRVPSRLTLRARRRPSTSSVSRASTA